MSAQVEKFAFQAEVQQVLHLVIHSLYSNKEIFLRELVSNSSDALDKLRFVSLQNPTLLPSSELAVEIRADAKAKTLSISDNGVGMSKSELIENLGTIARSGTKKFLEALSADKRSDANLIGQFGVGFYSAFIVADHVSVESRLAGSEECWKWTSDGTGEYSVETGTRDSAGTTITLHLKEDENEFLQPWRLRSLVEKYSDHIAFPVRLYKEEVKEGEPEFDVANKANALWTRAKAEISDDQYQKFYQDLTHESGEALTWAHNKVEGKQTYTSLLFVPKTMLMDLKFSQREERRGLKLYVKRVFIMDAAEQLLPNYLRFVRGVVDSDDLPLNVSRELLQEKGGLSALRSACTKRVLDLLEKLSTDQPEQYATFWAEYGSMLKEGLTEDFANRERIAKLLRFASTHNADNKQNVSLDDYISRLRTGQTEIYFITAETPAGARFSPHLEQLRAKNVEVLLLSDRIDEWAMGYLTQYQEKSLKSAAKGNIDLSNIVSDVAEPAAAMPLDDAFAKRFSTVLADRVGAVRSSARLVGSPACLVVGSFDMALHTQRLLKSAGQGGHEGKPDLEINATHPLIARLQALTDDTDFADLATLIYEQALLSEGGQLEDPASFVARLNKLLLKA
jgi:molecular chaperone HtpG